MIVVVCLHCSHALRVMSVNPGELEGLFESLPTWPQVTCPTCGKDALGYRAGEVDESVLKLMTTRDLSPIEAHAAILGVGFPEEQKCSGAVLTRLFKDNRIRRVMGRDIPNTERFCLDYMELWDGSRVYFGASTQGAIVYRIARPASYAKEVRDE